MASFLENLKAAKSAAIDSAAKMAGAGLAATDTVREAGNSVVETGLAAKRAAVDAVTDTTDAVVGYARATKDAAAMTFQGFQTYGLVVGLIVAPVPTLIGTIMIDVMTSLVMERFASVARNAEANKALREKDRLVERLAKYGKIPATAIVETESASLKLDVVAGTISGQVRTGFFSNREVGDMSTEELERFAASTDAETANLIQAYLRFREATPSQA